MKNLKDKSTSQEKINLIMTKIYNKMPDGLTGKREIWESKYRELFGEKDCSKEIYTEKTKIAKVYICLVVCLIILMVCAIISQIADSGEIHFIKRPPYGELPTKVGVNVKAQYDSSKVERKMNLSIKHKSLNKKEKEIFLKNYGNSLPSLIMGENDSLERVCGDLFLPEADGATGIVVNWTSDKPYLIDESGRVDLLDLVKKEEVLLTAEVALGDSIKEIYLKATVIPSKEKVVYKKLLARKLEALEKELEGNMVADTLVLPKNLGKSIGLSWSKGHAQPIGFILFAFMAGLALVYKKKFEYMDKEIKRRRESITKEFPLLMDKLVLLLNAGLVISTAISKIATDYAKRREVVLKKENKKAESIGEKIFCKLTIYGKREEERVLYEELCEIERRVRETNAPLLQEIKSFAKRSGVRELLRFSTVLSENMNKGATLAEKLEAEGELLWISRKKRAEELGRLAETKLTLPLMILLLVFIMITIAPALMEI